jgi:hypothetical protein
VNRIGVVLLLLVGCDRTDDIGKDTDPAHIRAAMCVRVKHPPRARCEEAAKENAENVVRARPTDGNFWLYTTDCSAALEAVARFASGTADEIHLRDACCSIPRGQISKSLTPLCAEYQPHPSTEPSR